MAVIDNLQRLYTNYSLLLLQLTEAMPGGQAPTQANIQAIVAAAGTAGILAPKPTSTIDGESYDWTGYQSFLSEQMLRIKKLIQIESGPFEVRSVAQT